MKNIIKLYVNFEIPKTPIEFIEKFYEDTSNYYNGVIQTGKETFFNKECTHLQCEINKYRSFEDLYSLITTYYPETSIAEFLCAICGANIKNGKFYNKPRFASCPTISRIRFFYSLENCMEEQNDNFEVNNFYLSNSKYDSNFSWSEIFQMVIGTDDTKEIVKFINKQRILRKDQIQIQKLEETQIEI